MHYESHVNTNWPRISHENQSRESLRNPNFKSVGFTKLNQNQKKFALEESSAPNPPRGDNTLTISFETTSTGFNGIPPNPPRGPQKCAEPSLRQRDPCPKETQRKSKDRNPNKIRARPKETRAGGEFNAEPSPRRQNYRPLLPVVTMLKWVDTLPDLILDVSLADTTKASPTICTIFTLAPLLTAISTPCTK